MNETTSLAGSAEHAPLTRNTNPVVRPPSSFSFSVGLCGVAAFLVAVYATCNLPAIHFVNPVYLTLGVMAFTALGVFIPDLFWKKSYRRVLNEKQKAPSPSWPRTITKFIGLLGCLGFVGFLYWLFPEYNTRFYKPYYQMLSIIMGPWLLVSIPYIWWVDARMAKPEDGLWHTGRFFMFQGKSADMHRVVQNLLGWVIKGFFLPLMFIYMSQALTKVMSIHMVRLVGFPGFYRFFSDLFFLADFSLCACGYLFTMRLTNTHIRSADQTLLGWVTALVCFEPFWTLVNGQYLAYESKFFWGDWLFTRPTFYAIWGTMILLLMLINVSSTVAFGMRYSNLTHRGILTEGPYRWSKHPAYIAQNLSWWLISVPFIVNGSVMQSLRQTLLLLALNGVYYLRAKTEERHLSHDPVYVQYAQWIEQNGLLAVLRRHVTAVAKATPVSGKE